MPASAPNWRRRWVSGLAVSADRRRPEGDAAQAGAPTSPAADPRHQPLQPLVHGKVIGSNVRRSCGRVARAARGEAAALGGRAHCATRCRSRSRTARAWPTPPPRVPGHRPTRAAASRAGRRTGRPCRVCDWKPRCALTRSDRTRHRLLSLPVCLRQECRGNTGDGEIGA